jgi:hypothetical protein
MKTSSGKSRNVVWKYEVIGGNNEIMAIYEANKLPLSVYFVPYSHEIPLFNIIACHGISYGSVSVLFSVHRR